MFTINSTNGGSLTFFEVTTNDNSRINYVKAWFHVEIKLF